MPEKDTNQQQVIHLSRDYANSPEEDFPDCKRAEDRRKFSLYGFLVGCVKRRRRTARRDCNAEGYYTDWYSPRLRLLALSLILLSSCDAIFTMILLSKGATEVNPIMAALIERDLLVFFIAKLLMTATPLMLLLIHHNFRIFKRIRVENVITVSVMGYFLLIVYELFLLGLI